LGELPENELFGDWVQKKLIYYPTVIREKFGRQSHQQRITHLLTKDTLTQKIGLPPIYLNADRWLCWWQSSDA